ncbi:MAG TPA: hypothetical protein VF250_02210, partial [Conexibacter sp.]
QDGRPPRSHAGRLAPLGVFLGAAGFAAGLTCAYLAMRDLMVYAGSTAAGGGSGSGMDAGFLMWAALFGALGWNFLSLGFDPPASMSGAGGWIVAGVLFELMALGGVVPLVWSAREWVARGGAPEEPLFEGPVVRAKPKPLNSPRRDWRAP